VIVSPSYCAALGGLERLERDLILLKERLAAPPTCPACGTECRFRLGIGHCPLCGEPVPPPDWVRWPAFVWRLVERLWRFKHRWPPACVKCQQENCSGRHPWQPPGPDCPDWDGYVERRGRYVAKRVEGVDRA